MTVAAGDIDAAFEAALAKDAGADPPVTVPAPPRRPDPEAPHGRAEDGSPMAPYGMKADGTPRLKPAGPGRGGKTDKPRVEDSPAPAAAADGSGPDFTADLTTLGLSVWLGASMIRGGKLWRFRLPDTRPYAAVWKQELPRNVAAWNLAAKQNATVRGYVKKLSGDGSWSWVLAVGLAGVSTFAGIVELAKAGPEVRAQVADVNDAAMQVFVQEQMEAMGLMDQERTGS